MRYVLLLIMMCGTVFAYPPVSSRPNIYRGYNYYQGGRYLGGSRPNIYGGYNYYRYDGRPHMRSSPNIYGGYNYYPYTGYRPIHRLYDNR